MLNALRYALCASSKAYKTRNEEMSIQPEGEEIRRAVKWISDERKFNPEMELVKVIQIACVKFNLSPNESDFLYRIIVEGEKKG